MYQSTHYKPIPQDDSKDHASLTQPGLAINMTELFRRLKAGEPVPILSLSYDKDPSIDDPDTSDIDPRHISSEQLKRYFSDVINNDPKNEVIPNDDNV